MSVRGPLALVLGAAVSVVALTGCGGSSTGSSRPAGPSSATSPTPAPSAGDRVAMGEYYFRPGAITVKVGEPVTFVNDGKIQHTVADTTPAGRIRSRLIKPRPLDPGQTQTVVFHAPGTVTYLCTFHPTLMSGRIVVTR